MSRRSKISGTRSPVRGSDRCAPIIPTSFDGLEISPCRLSGIANQTSIATCSPHVAHFWTVYGHRRSGGVKAFVDFLTYREARCFAERLLRRNPHLAHHGIYEPNGNGGAK